MFVLYPINVKTTEPIGPKFFEGPSLKGEGLWKIEFSTNYLQQNSIFENPQFFLHCPQREMFTIKMKDGRRVFIRKTFAQFLRKKVQIFAFISIDFFAKK